MVRIVDTTEIGYIGFETGLGSIRKSTKRIGSKLSQFTKKVGKSTKKGFIKAAPILGVAAQALNFIVPGLGAAVGLAINLGAQALSAQEQKKVLEKEAKEEERRRSAEEAERATQEAERAMTAAFMKGEPYFVSRYGVTLERFQSMTLKDRYLFLMGVVYDLNAEKFTSRGVSKERFLEMEVSDQANLLDQINRESGLLTAEEAAMGRTRTFPWTIVLLGSAAVLAVVIIIVARKSRS
jgi:hypothetical protein